MPKMSRIERAARLRFGLPSPTSALWSCPGIILALLVSCTRSHEPGLREVRVDDCELCHEAEYLATTAPPHVDVFPPLCALCHSTEAWVPADFNHGNVSEYACVLCHRPDYLATTNPAHPGIFPEGCELCHTTVSWAPSTFSHEAVRHEPCLLCHQSDYEGASNPVHVGSFPTTCGDCHSTTAWRPAISGVHPESDFPINGGAHEGIACTECHDPDRGSSVGGANTDCVGCHSGEHSESRMNNKHDEVGDYSFDAEHPNFCLECHPRGRH